MNAVEEHKKLLKFISTEKNIVTTGSASTSKSSIIKFIYQVKCFFFSYFCDTFLFFKYAGLPSTSTSSISNMANGKEKDLPSFWVPSQAPAAKTSKVEKPDSQIYCPVSQKPFKAKDLINVKFTLVKDSNDKKSLIVKENRYMCAVTHDILSNSVPCAVLRPT